MVRFEFNGHSYDLNWAKFLEQNVFYLVLIVAGCVLLKFVGNLVKFVQEMQKQIQAEEAATAAEEEEKDNLNEQKLLHKEKLL